MAAPNLAARNCFFVNYVGTDDPGYNAIGAPWSYTSLAAALAALASVANPPSAANPWTIALGPGDFNIGAFEIPAWVWITGSADNEGGSSTLIRLSGDVTLHPNWAAGATRGGFCNVRIGALSGDHAFDFAMPAPSSGTPARQLDFIGVETDRPLAWFAAIPTDTFNWQQSVNTGSFQPNTDHLNMNGGIMVFDGGSSQIPVYFQDLAAIPIGGTLNGFFVADTAGCAFTATLTACVFDLSGSHLGLVTFDQSGSGTLTVNADASSLPVKAAISIVGTPTINRTTDAFGVGYTPAVPGKWSPVPATVQAALDQLAGASTGGGTSALFTTNNNQFATVLVTPSTGIWAAVVSQTGTASNRIVALDKTGTNLALGNRISLLLIIAVGGGINVSVTSGAGGSVVGTFNDGNGAATANFEFVYGTTAAGFPTNDWYPLSYTIPATT